MRIYRRLLTVWILVATIAVVIANLSLNKGKGKLEGVKIDECEKFEYYETRMVCYAYFLQNYSVCNLVPNMKDLCYLFATLKSKNITICNDINDETGKVACIFGFAEKMKDPEICEYLERPFLIENCLLQLSSYHFVSPKLCDYISHQSTRYICLAEATNNLSYCENITSEPWERNLCFAILKKDVSFCQGYDPCILEFSIYFKNLTLCESIKPPSNSKCIGLLSKNFKECEKIEWKGIPRDLCKLYVIYSKELGQSL